MINRRDWLLQQLGISQWTLRRPAVLQGEVAVVVPAGTRLLLVADPPPETDHPLIADVARSMGLRGDQLFVLTPDQVLMLAQPARCPSWWLVTADAPPPGVTLHSPPLATLMENALAKRELWRQIGDYESDNTAEPERS